MLFNSLQYLIFFPTVVAVYFLLPHRYRWLWLLLASCLFYMAFIPIYILVLGVTIVIDYVAAIAIEQTVTRKKLYLLLSIVSTCLVLFIFKYFNFFNDNVIALANYFHWQYPISTWQLILPIGLSFHTFQSLSYVIEVYKGKQKAERHFGIYALYVMFFPQLVAGPIERPQNILHQFYERHHFEYKQVVAGLRLLLWGLILKVVIADRLGLAVNEVYGHIQQYAGIPFVLGTYFFAFQIYCDFAGYSLMALGSAKVMGFTLMTNFKQPYQARSISEFWQRWHISLFSWFRDYVYIPLGGNRVNTLRRYSNLLIVFILSGLWHGAAWHYVVWGLLNGLYLVVATATRDWRTRLYTRIGLIKFPKLQAALQIITTFHLIALSWVFFRANSLGEAWYSLTHVLTNLSFDSETWRLGLPTPEFIIALGSVGLMGVVAIVQKKFAVQRWFEQRSLVWQLTVYSLIVVGIICFGVFEEKNFIYFQF